MSDFFQNGEIATFHRLGKRDISELEAELGEATRHHPVSLVLPYILSNSRARVFQGL